MNTHEEAALLAELEALEKEEQKRKRWTEWCPHHPHAKQQEFLSLTCEEALYGGAAGGGKSDALLMAALQYVDRPGYSALILRRTFRDLNQPEAIMARAHEWLQNTRAVWHERDKRYTFPSGATLTFGYLDNDKDKYQYQGAALQYIGWDELTQFPESWYTWLFSRLRKLGSVDIPLRVRAATNPGGLGHEWVRRRFIDPPSPERPFIPASLDDNPSVDAESYRRSLSKLDAVTRRQMEDGVWVRDASGLVYRRPQTLTARPYAIEEDWAYLMGVDFGVKDALAYVILGWRKNDRRVYVLESFKETDSDVTQSAERILEYGKRYPFSHVVGDLGGMGKSFGVEFQRRWGIPIEPAQKVNKRGFQGLLNGAIERGDIVVIEPSNVELLKEIAELPWADESHMKEADGFENHLTDALLYAWRATTAYSQAIAVPPPTDPLDVIRKQTAAVWARHEDELRRGKAEDALDSYDLGSKFFGDEDF